jgi:hypothetical protein
LASGSKDGDVLLRNVDTADILSRTRFRRRRCRTVAPDEELPTKILDHEYASYKTEALLMIPDPRDRQKYFWT